MGNQNATAMHEEEKAADQSTVNLSIDESSIVEESQVDQLILPTAETHELSASRLSDHEPLNGAELDIKEPNGYDEIERIEKEAADTKDDPIDQEIKDTNLNLTGAVLNEPDNPLHSDARVDDHALEKLNQDPSLLVCQESKRASTVEGETQEPVDEIMLETKDELKEVTDTVEISSEPACKTISQHDPETSFGEEVIKASSSVKASQDEGFFRAEAVPDATIEHNNTKEDPVNENMLEAKDELKEVTDTVEISSEQACKTSSQHDPETSFVEEVITESSSSKASQDEVFFRAEAIPDATIKHNNTKEDPVNENMLEAKEVINTVEEGADIKGMNCIDEQTGEIDQSQDTDLQVNDTSSAFEGSDDDQEEISSKVTKESSAEKKDPELADFKDLEIDHPQEVGSDKQKAQTEIEKSPSFNFGLLNWDKMEELDQTPVLYHKKLNTMRSLSAPDNARLFVPADRSAEEKTIKIVQERRRECNVESKSPLHGFLKETEETHLLKPQESCQNDQNLEARIEMQNGNGMEIVAQGKEKRNKAKISGSYLSSICICCTGVSQLNSDP